MVVYLGKYADTRGMKTKDEEEKTTRSTVPFPVYLWDKVKKEAKRHRRSANDELIFILSEYFDDSFVKLETTIKRAVAKYAETKSFTIAEATNYLVSTKISVFEIIEDNVIKEANREYDEEVAGRKKESMM
jgi:hypothetical protein